MQPSGGTYKAESGLHTGFPSLAQAIRDLQLDHVQDVELDYAASSLGAINDTLLQRLHLAARGEPWTVDSKATEVRKKTRIYFPTKETVERSVGGPACGGVISLSPKSYYAPTFPKECLRNYDSTRRGMLSHNKLLFARGRKTDGRPFAWVYVGSANMSEAAWGGQRVLKNGSMGSLVVRNWECGIIMPVADEKMAELELGAGEIPPMSVFEGTVEMGFQYPGEQYGSSSNSSGGGGGGKEPWLLRAEE